MCYLLSVPSNCHIPNCSQLIESYDEFFVCSRDCGVFKSFFLGGRSWAAEILQWILLVAILLENIPRSSGYAFLSLEVETAEIIAGGCYLSRFPKFSFFHVVKVELGCG